MNVIYLGTMYIPDHTNITIKTKTATNSKVSNHHQLTRSASSFPAKRNIQKLQLQLQ